MAVLVPQAEFHHILPLASFDRGNVLERRLPVFGVQQAQPTAEVMGNLVLGIAEHLFVAGRVPDFVGFQVPVPHALLGGLHGQVETILAGPQGMLDLFLLADVLQEDNNPAVLPGNAAVMRPAVQVRGIILELPRLSRGDTAIFPLQSGPQGGGKGLQKPCAEHLVPAAAKDLRGRVIEGDDPPLGIAGLPPVRHGFEQDCQFTGDRLRRRGVGVGISTGRQTVH